MAQQIVCDQCGKTTRDDFGWWSLDANGVTMQFGQVESPYNLCSLDCVATFAAKNAGQAVSMLRPYGRYRG